MLLPNTAYKMNAGQQVLGLHVPETVDGGEGQLQSPQPFSEDKLAQFHRRLPTGKAPGPDSILNEIIKLAYEVDGVSLLATFNRCLDKQTVPTACRVADLVLLPKPGKPPVDLGS